MSSFSDLKNYIPRLIRKVRRLKLQKMHLDYVAGMLSIPVLVTAIIINFTNISKKEAATPTPGPTPQVIVVPEHEKEENKPRQVAIPTNSPVCKKSIGPLTITSPEEGDTVTENPVCITIDYSDENYCSVVWSYRINNGSWSEYNNNAPCLYNLPNGTISFQLRVNSTVSNESKTYTRNFTYTGSTQPTPATSSAN